ncbi:MAG: UbiA family prenyltransferase, partial [Defluviicoccus sp.]|nr:UbiA family prenyltransferase [Defluviicoccus sp.]
MSGIDDTAASDIPKGRWVDRLLPAAARPYARLARLDRPIGTWLLLFPCWWSIAFASPQPLSSESLILFATFGIGALVMRGAGCTFNDICDRDFDAQVARTRDRPLPSGQVTVRGAVAFLAVLLVAGLAILLTLKPFAIAVGAASLVLVFTYPLSKRVTYWPQFVLGLAFNWGAL